MLLIARNGNIINPLVHVTDVNETNQVRYRNA